MLGPDGSVTCTFVIDRDRALLIADRRSEHVACASGGPVLSAGEMRFGFTTDSVVVEGVTNQSTGYCPEPRSWNHVADALDEIGLEHPGGFSTKFVFRRCHRCESTNLVKDDWYYCAVCNADLPADWNFA